MTAIDERFSTTTAIPTVALNDEAQMPVLGLGVAKLSDAETESSVVAAIEAGCRLIDTAAACGNEEAVGRAIAASGLPREELFVTTSSAPPSRASKVPRNPARPAWTGLGWITWTST